METILITGVTSSIGEELAFFLSKNYQIILSGRDIVKLEKLQNKLIGSNHLIWSCDFTTENIKESLETFLRTKDVKPNHFLHVGGEFTITPLRLQKYENTVKSFQVNVFSAIEIVGFLCKKEFKSHLKNIIFFSSISTKKGISGYAVYSAAKSSLIGLTKSLAIELSPIRVNCLVIGAILTKSTEYILKGNETLLNSNIPLGLSNSSILNEWVLFLLKNNIWMTGQELIIDGGATVL
jgi:NAD(P)-dependent dehydrogenase (short-subunit alcohol dehydrogenase family)